MIEIEKLSFSYDQNKVFEDLAFSLNDVPVTSLLGLNGQGKTTFIRLLLGLLRPDKGRITIDGQDVSGLNDKERSRLLSYVPQENDSDLIMSVSDFICLGGIGRQDFFRGPDPADCQRAKDILKDLDAEELTDCHMEALSSGQRRLAYLSRAIFQDSRVMVLDEPVSSLDLIRQHDFLKLLRIHAKEGKGRVIMSMHDPVLAHAYSDAFVFFKDGGSFDVLYKDHPDFRERFAEDIGRLYEGRAALKYLDERLFIEV